MFAVVPDNSENALIDEATLRIVSVCAYARALTIHPGVLMSLFDKAKDAAHAAFDKAKEATSAAARTAKAAGHVVA